MVGAIGGVDNHHDCRLDHGQRDRSLGRPGNHSDRWKSDRCFPRTTEGESGCKGHPRGIRRRERHRWRVAGSSIEAGPKTWTESSLAVASRIRGDSFLCSPRGSNFVDATGHRGAALGASTGRFSWTHNGGAKGTSHSRERLRGRNGRCGCFPFSSIEP